MRGLRVLGGFGEAFTAKYRDYGGAQGHFEVMGGDEGLGGVQEVWGAQILVWGV